MTSRLSYQLDPKAYSLGDALKLKVCIGHYRAAVQATSPISRINHAALAIFNCIPLLAVVELIVVSRYGKAAEPLHVPPLKYIEIPLIYIGNGIAKSVHHAQFYFQHRQLPKLIEEANKIPVFQNPLTYTQDEYESKIQSYEEVKAFFVRAGQYVELFNKRRVEFGTDSPLFNELEAQLKKVTPPAENLWELAKTFLTLSNEIEALNSEINICGRETSRKAKDWKAKAQALYDSVKKFEGQTKHTQPNFYNTRLSPLADIAMDLLRVTRCLEMEVLLGIEAAQDQALFQHTSRLTTPEKASVSAVDNDLAKELLQIANDIRICKEKATKRLGELETLRSSATSITSGQFILFKQNAEIWIANAIKTCNAELASVKSAQTRLENPIKAAKIICELFKMNLGLTSLSNDNEATNRYILNIVEGAESSYASQYGQFAKGVRHRIESLRAQQLTSLKAAVDKANPLAKSLNDVEEKIARYEQKIDLIILWSDIAQCCTLLDQGSMGNNAISDEMSLYSKNMDLVKEKLNAMKDNISVFDKLKSYFRESQEEKDKKQLLQVCERIATLLNRLEQKSQNNRETQKWSQASRVSTTRSLTLLGLDPNPTAEQVNTAVKKLRTKFHPDFYERKKQILLDEHSIRTPEEAKAKWDEINAAKDSLLETIKN